MYMIQTYRERITLKTKAINTQNSPFLIASSIFRLGSWVICYYCSHLVERLLKAGLLRVSHQLPVEQHFVGSFGWPEEGVLTPGRCAGAV